MKYPTLAENFQDLKRQVIQNASPLVEIELERMFYAGASTAFSLIVDNIAHQPEADVRSDMERLQSEIRHFFNVTIHKQKERIQ